MIFDFWNAYEASFIARFKIFTLFQIIYNRFKLKNFFQMEDELDMEVELERELQAEQEELEEELCLQALDLEMQLDNAIKRPLGKVLSLPANFVYHTGASSKGKYVSEKNFERSRG